MSAQAIVLPQERLSFLVRLALVIAAAFTILYLVWQIAGAIAAAVIGPFARWACRGVDQYCNGTITAWTDLTSVATLVLFVVVIVVVLWVCFRWSALTVQLRDMVLWSLFTPEQRTRLTQNMVERREVRERLWQEQLECRSLEDD